MNRLSPLFEIKRADLQADGLFTGYASTFDGPPDAYGDIIKPGAFTKSLAQHATNKTMPAFLWSHDQDQVLGKWLDFTETAHGLKVKGQLTLEVEKARDAYALMKDGALGLSIGFMIPQGGSEWDSQQKVRVLKQVNLFEVSTVAMPANPAAKITQVKSIRDLEFQLRDELNFSAREAKRIAAGGYPALVGRDVHHEDEIRTLVNEVRSLTESIRKII